MDATAPATYANAAGDSLLAIKSKLGHASVAFTGDVYTSLLHELDHHLAKRTAASKPSHTARVRSRGIRWADTQNRE